MWLNNVRLKDRVIENERLELSDPDALYFLGDNLTLRNCTLVLRVPTRRLHIFKAWLINCTIEAKQALKNFRWNQAHLRGCRFKGRFQGNDFGNWEDTAAGSIEDCDFTEAWLHHTRFLSCDARTLRLPRWPCFTLFDPVRRWRDWRALQWPGDIGPITIQLFAEQPATTAAVTFSAPDLAKRSGTAPEAIRAVLEKLDGVYY